MTKNKEMLNSKMQVNLPDSLSTENIMATIESSKAEVIEMPKKKNNAKKIVPLVASLLLVVGIVGMYMSLQEKDIPVNDSVENAEVMRYESYDKVYEKFDKLLEAHPLYHFMEFCLHEQYFYPEYFAYQPNYYEKLETAAQWCKDRGFEPVFADEMFGFHSHGNL
jgi:hypothetical protein